VTRQMQFIRAAARRSKIRDAGPLCSGAVPTFAPSPMLAQLERTLPHGDVWRYEPKLDGFRGLLWRRAGMASQLLSRNVKDLSPWFPELIQAGSALPPNTVVDGEIVIADDRGCSDFGALQARLGVAQRDAAQTARERPAVLLCFDVLALADHDLIMSPLTERRRSLEDLVVGLHPCLQLVTQTHDRQLAEQWLAMLPSVEGVVAKRADSRYSAGRQHAWIKVKRQRTVDCVVIGIAGQNDSPRLVLGLRHGDQELHHFGVTRPISPDLVKPLAHVLRQAGPQERPIRSRWGHDAVPEWRRVPASAVCEVGYVLLDGDRWLRQPATFLRWRPERSAVDCGLDQLVRAATEQ
jgi:ATP-dependent DNA ligase